MSNPGKQTKYVVNPDRCFCTKGLIQNEAVHFLLTWIAKGDEHITFVAHNDEHADRLLAELEELRRSYVRGER